MTNINESGCSRNKRANYSLSSLPRISGQWRKREVDATITSSLSFVPFLLSSFGSRAREVETILDRYVCTTNLYRYVCVRERMNPLSARRVAIVSRGILNNDANPAGFYSLSLSYAFGSIVYYNQIPFTPSLSLCFFLFLLVNWEIKGCGEKVHGVTAKLILEGKKGWLLSALVIYLLLSFFLKL